MHLSTVLKSAQLVLKLSQAPKLKLCSGLPPKNTATHCTHTILQDLTGMRNDI